MLTAKRVERTKKPGRYGCGIVKGLYLQISNGRAKSWVLRYERLGKEHMMGLGSVSDFNLKEVRERARQARQLLADGIDPLANKLAAKQAAKIAEQRQVTFIQAAERYFNANEKRWRNKTHRDAFLGTLKAHAGPILNMDVATIGVSDVLRCLEPGWAEKAVTLDRTRARIKQVLDWATVRDHRPAGVNPAQWTGLLDQVLPPPRQVAPIIHHNAMPYANVPAFMVKLRQEQTVAARALELLILCASRTGEVIGATWDEIDLANKTWTIPAQRMKGGREHRVPLSEAAIALLRALPTEEGNRHVFVGRRGGAGLSDETLRVVMNRLGQEGVTTIHGYRSSFRDWAGETTAFAHDICEAALAHVRGDHSVRAYARGDLFDKRRKLMAAWATYLSKPPTKATGDVVAIRAV
jgi:integrase